LEKTVLLINAARLMEIRFGNFFQSRYLFEDHVWLLQKPKKKREQRHTNINCAAKFLWSYDT